MHFGEKAKTRHVLIVRRFEQHRVCYLLSSCPVRTKVIILILLDKRVDPFLFPLSVFFILRFGTLVLFGLAWLVCVFGLVYSRSVRVLGHINLAVSDGLLIGNCGVVR